MLKNSSTLAVSVPVNLSIKLGFVYINGPREPHFIDALSSSIDFQQMTSTNCDVSSTTNYSLFLRT